jgi:hypothetical protein
VPLQAEEVPVAAAAVEASIAPPPPFPAAVVEEGETATEAPASRAALVTLTKAGQSGEDAKVVVDEDSVALPSLENRDVGIHPVSEPAQVAATASLLPAVEAPEPYPVAEVLGPPPTAEVVETSSA